MRLNERWIWVDDTTSADVAGIVAFNDSSGQWWLARGSEMAGPFADSCILRALRIACTPVVDGCEKGPGRSGFLELENRGPLQPRAKWRERAEAEMPPSITTYDEEGLEPAIGCCTTFDSPPRVTCWGTIASLESFLDSEFAYVGVLKTAWNAHPQGSLVFCKDKKSLAGLTIVDLPNPTSK